MLDAAWQYVKGLLVQLHSAWDPNGGVFRHGFHVMLEKGTLLYDLHVSPGTLQLYRGGRLEEVPVDPPDAHQAELDDFARCITEGRRFTRFTPADSRRAVEIGLEELRCMRER